MILNAYKFYMLLGLFYHNKHQLTQNYKLPHTKVTQKPHHEMQLFVLK